MNFNPPTYLLNPTMVPVNYHLFLAPFIKLLSPISAMDG